MKPNPLAASDALGPFELSRLEGALMMDALPDIATNPAYQRLGPFVERLADEIGMTVEALLTWGAANGVPHGAIRAPVSASVAYRFER